MEKVAGRFGGCRDGNFRVGVCRDLLDQASTEGNGTRIRPISDLAMIFVMLAYVATNVQGSLAMYGHLLRQLRESKGRSQADVARSVSISPAQLARLETSQRGLYLEDFIRIAEALGEKAGNLLPNDLGEIGHLKPLINRLAAVPPELLPRVSSIIEKLVLLTQEMTPTKRTGEK